jgi:hypothetical protein
MALIGAFGLFFLGSWTCPPVRWTLTVASALLVAVRAFKGRGYDDHYDYTEPTARAARGFVQAAKTVAGKGNQVAPNVQEWEPPVNRWGNEGYIQEEWVYY